VSAARAKTTLGQLRAKYGSTLRKKFVSIYLLLHRRRRCPSCSRRGFSRIANGIWACPHCGLKLAGNAYEP